MNAIGGGGRALNAAARKGMVTPGSCRFGPLLCPAGDSWQTVPTAAFNDPYSSAHMDPYSRKMGNHKTMKGIPVSETLFAFHKA
jgi:hypothetical protein